MHRHPPIYPPLPPPVVHYGPEPIPLRPEPHVPLTPKTGMRREEIEQKIADGGVSAEEKAAWNGKYSKPSGGIPKTDLASDVRSSLGKADTALQSHQSLSGYATEAWVVEQGFITEHQDIGGKADLVDGKVPASQLPSYVGDVLEYASASAFPTSGEAGKIYVALDSNKTYRWGGSQYVMVGGGDPPVTSVNNKTGAVTLTAADVGAQAVMASIMVRQTKADIILITGFFIYLHL